MPHRPGPGRPRTFDHADAQRLYGDGLRVSEVARHLGVSWKAVKRAVDPGYAAEDNARVRVSSAVHGLVRDGEVEFVGWQTAPSSRGPRSRRTFRYVGPPR